MWLSVIQSRQILQDIQKRIKQTYRDGGVSIWILTRKLRNNESVDEKLDKNKLLKIK